MDFLLGLGVRGRMVTGVIRPTALVGTFAPFDPKLKNKITNEIP